LHGEVILPVVEAPQLVVGAPLSPPVTARRSDFTSPLPMDGG